MSLPKPDIERFTIGGDFSLWRMKMRALLVHQGLEDVKASLSSKEIQKNNGHEISNGEGLFARTEKKNQKKKNKSQAKKDDVSVKEKMKKRKCFYCKKQGHYIRDCVEKKRDEKERIGDAAVASDDSSDDGYHSADLLVASNSNIKGQWVLDLGCSFHLCPDKKPFSIHINLWMVVEC